MLNENARLWVEALRSGKYKQGKGRLKFEGDDNVLYYCCLGVACEVYQRNVGDLKEDKDNYLFSFDLSQAYLPQKVQEWLSLKTESGAYLSDSLTGLNDKGVSFSEIADVIESEPRGLFVDTSDS